MLRVVLGIFVTVDSMLIVQMADILIFEPQLLHLVCQKVGNPLTDGGRVGEIVVLCSW